MYRIVLIIIALLLMGSGARASGTRTSGASTLDTLSFTQINTESYRLYLVQEWDSLISLGKEALKQDIDFYYLRMRLGIARYEQEKYRQSWIHFRKALEFNQADPLAQEYLYYALLLAGQGDQAMLLRKEFKGDLALKLAPVKGEFLEHLGVEFLYNKALTEELLSDPDALFADLPPGVQYLTRDYFNASLSLGNRLSPGIRLNHLFTYLSKNNFYYYNDGLYQLQLDPQHVKQYQYYISPSFTIPSGFTFMPMFHLVSIHYQAPVFFSQGMQGGNPRVAWGYSDKLNVVSGLNVLKTAGNLDLQLAAWYANLNNMQQVQNRLGLTWYPLGNLNFYLGAYLNSQYEMTDSTGILRFIPEAHAGLAIAKKVWLDLNAAFGDMTNYLEQNGSLVFNSFSDIIQKKAGLTLSVLVSEKGSVVYLGGRWSAHQSTFYPFYPADTDVTNSLTYNAISIYGGLTWKF